MNRRQILRMGLVVGGAAVLARSVVNRHAWAQTGEAPPEGLYEGEFLLGDPEAPITIIEYSSLTCPHCQSFHQQTLPKLKEEWIDTGKANLAYRHFPLDRLAVIAAMLSNCTGEKRFFNFVDLLFDKQRQWSRSDDPISVLRGYARLAGLSDQEFEDCLRDQAELDRILDRKEEGSKAFGISSTPTFIIEGNKIEGAQPYEVFKETLESI